ncbi:MAG: hypothetical protein EBT63_03220 [Proteobacteria bacterium]|nr:hypothetical protein [Pseudomonadota bacterium]NCA28299.1 hypothetical protein [Pseudomonadota bacterium]
MKFRFLLITLLLTINHFDARAVPLISGISSNEINVDTEFKGAQILLFGAKSDAGNIVISVRGPRKSFIVSKKENLLGVWYNGERVSFKNSYSFYSLFSTFNNGRMIEDNLNDFELGKNNIKFEISQNLSPSKMNEFRIQLVELLENKQYFASNTKPIDFLDETLFKVMIDFPKNILLGTYVVEIYLINNGSILSYQSIPIYVNQVGLSAKISDFASNQSVLYGLLAVFIAVFVGILTNYFFVKFIKK